MKQLDFVAIGDIVTDAFIELEDAWIETDNPEGSKELCMRFGDKIPYRKADIVKAVGNGPNAAVAAKRLGLETAIITDLGDDEHGAGCIGQLREEGVSEEFVQIHAGMGTNYHYVLRLGAERTILVKHEKYPYDLPDLAQRSPKWIYLTSLSDNSLDYHMQIADFLEKNPNTKLAFQPGTYQMKFGVETLARIYAESDLFFCNKEEAQRILDSKSKDIKVLAKKLMEHGPKVVVISDGPEGATAFDGEKYWQTSMYPDPKPPVDRTGAGDSFSSTFVAAIILGKTIPEALAWGPINSMSVVQEIGAQRGLLSREKLEEYLADAPEGYGAKEI
jgi:ribokinase